MRWAALFILLLSQLAATPTSRPAHVEGDWLGTLDLGAARLRLAFHIKREQGKLAGTLDSIDQGAKGIPLSQVTADDKKVDFEIKTLGASFEGNLSGDGKSIVGRFTQLGTSLPLTLSRTSEIPQLARPQEPKPPFPYSVHEVSFANRAAGIVLSGTLTVPKSGGRFPAVVMIAGSGPLNRDEEVMGHRPFLVLADALTRRGIAVLRYDKRGVANSAGSYQAATGRDFADDAKAAFEYLKSRDDIDASRIGLLGHSEGGLIAPRVAADSPRIAFVVLLAAPGVSGAELLPVQQQAILRAMGSDPQTLQFSKDYLTKVIAIVNTTKGGPEAQQQIEHLTGEFTAKLPPTQREAAEASMKAMPAVMTSAWFRQFLAYDPTKDLARVKCPVLALYGEKDLQVPPDQNLRPLQTALQSGGNKDVTVKVFPGLNHLFQPCKTGAPMEYSSIETTFSPEAIEWIGDWIKDHVKRP